MPGSMEMLGLAERTRQLEQRAVRREAQRRERHGGKPAAISALGSGS